MRHSKPFPGTLRMSTRMVRSLKIASGKEGCLSVYAMEKCHLLSGTALEWTPVHFLTHPRGKMNQVSREC